MNRETVENPFFILLALFVQIIGVFLGLGVGLFVFWLFIVLPFDFISWAGENLHEGWFIPLVLLWFVIGPLIMAWFIRQIQLARKG